MEKHHISAAVSKAAVITTQVERCPMFCFWMKGWRAMEKQRTTGGGDVIRGVEVDKEGGR